MTEHVHDENCEHAEMTEAAVPTSGEPVEQILIAYGTLFNQLLQSAKFRMFMDTYYTIQRVVDEDKKEITLQVIENPPEVIGEKITAAAVSAAREEASKIQIAQPGEANALAKKIVQDALKSAKKGKKR